MKIVVSTGFNGGFLPGFTGPKNTAKLCTFWGGKKETCHIFFETVTGVPILSASSSTGLMIFSWLLFSERRSAQTKRFLRNLLASPVPVKVAVAREDPEYPNVARRLQYDF